MKTYITAVIAAISIATAFAQEPQSDSCKQSGFNFITKQEYERMARYRREYPFFPSKDAEVNIRGGSLELRLDSKWLELKSCFEHGEYSIAYRYVGYIDSTQTYVCDSIGLQDRIVLLVSKKNGEITPLCYFVSFDYNGEKFVTYDLVYGDLLGGVIKVYEYIDGEYACVKEIRGENWYPAGVYFYDDKVIGKIEYFDNDKVDYFWFHVKSE